MIDIKPFVKRCLDDKWFWVNGGCIESNVEKFYVEKYHMTEGQVKKFWSAMCALYGLNYELQSDERRREYDKIMEQINKEEQE